MNLNVDSQAEYAIGNTLSNHIEKEIESNNARVSVSDFRKLDRRVSRKLSFQDQQKASDLLQQIKAVKNRIRYIDQTTAKNEKLLRETIQKTNTFEERKQKAREMSIKVERARQQKEADKEILKNKVHEINNQKKAVQEKIDRSKQEKQKMSSVVRKQRDELKGQPKINPEPAPNGKKSKAEPVKSVHNLPFGFSFANNPQNVKKGEELKPVQKPKYSSSRCIESVKSGKKTSNPPKSKQEPQFS